MAARNEVKGVLRSHFHARDELELVSRADLQRRMKQGLVTVLDVRPGDEFAFGHLHAARNVPLPDQAPAVRARPQHAASWRMLPIGSGEWSWRERQRRQKRMEVESEAR
jgi:rhodanese-related sulfurtransferase